MFVTFVWLQVPLSDWYIVILLLLIWLLSSTELFGQRTALKYEHESKEGRLIHVFPAWTSIPEDSDVPCQSVLPRSTESKMDALTP